MNKRILVVDDEKNIRTTLSTYLVSSGFDVDLASNGNEALDKLKKLNFDLVLLDIKMHGLTGTQVLSEMRKQNLKTNVIMITAYGTIGNAVESMKLGAIDFISKPFTLEDLKVAVNNALKRQDLEEREIHSFSGYLQFSKKCIIDKDFEKAKEYLKKAMVENTESPEPQNLLGIIYEYEGDLLTAGKHYRAALELDPTYKPSQENLERVTLFRYSKEDIKFGDEEEEEKKEE